MSEAGARDSERQATTSPENLDATHRRTAERGARLSRGRLARIPTQRAPSSFSWRRVALDRRVTLDVAAKLAPRTPASTWASAGRLLESCRCQKHPCRKIALRAPSIAEVRDNRGRLAGSFDSDSQASRLSTGACARAPCRGTSRRPVVFAALEGRECIHYPGLPNIALADIHERYWRIASLTIQARLRRRCPWPGVRVQRDPRRRESRSSRSDEFSVTLRAVISAPSLIMMMHHEGH